MRATCTCMHIICTHREIKQHSCQLFFIVALGGTFDSVTYLPAAALPTELLYIPGCMYIGFVLNAQLVDCDFFHYSENA